MHFSFFFQGTRVLKLDVQSRLTSTLVLKIFKINFHFDPIFFSISDCKIYECFPIKPDVDPGHDDPLKIILPLIFLIPFASLLGCFVVKKCKFASIKLLFCIAGKNWKKRENLGKFRKKWEKIGNIGKN